MAFLGRQIFKIRQITIAATRLYATGENVQQKIELEDKVAAITGGASGIGFAIAREFLTEGITCLTVIDHDNEAGKASLKRLADEFGEEKVLFMEADVTNTVEMDNALKNTVLHYDTLDIIINNAGIMDDGQWERQLRTNLNGCVIGTLLGMQYMAKSSSGEGGTIVNIGSVMGIVPSSGFPIYTMTQFGIAGFTKALGSSNLFSRTGVKVFGYFPGPTDTDMIKNISEKTINDNFAHEYIEELGENHPQTPESVAKGLVMILEDAKAGSLWVVENNQVPFKVNLDLRTTSQETVETTRVIEELISKQPLTAAVYEIGHLNPSDEINMEE